MIYKEENFKNIFSCFLEIGYLQKQQEEVKTEINNIHFNQILINKVLKWLKNIVILCLNKQIN